MQKFYHKLFKTTLSTVLTVVISSLLAMGFAYAATTISANIVTGGTLSVTGETSLSTASTTGNFWLGNQTADDDDYLYMDASSTEYIMWDDDPGQFAFSDDVQISGNASTTGYIRVGTLAGDDDDYLYMDATTSEEYLM